MTPMSPKTASGPLCERRVAGVACAKGPEGRPDQAVGQVGGSWYCRAHIGAAKAVAMKRKDRGFRTCSVPDCSRPAAERDGKCAEHRAGERAVGGSVAVVEYGSGRGDHPYAPKRAEIYLALFPELGLLKIGKAAPWTVSNRVRDAAQKAQVRRVDSDIHRSAAHEVVAWSISIFGEENVLWAVSERVEHAAAGRLAHIVDATSVPHTEGKEWLRHDLAADVDWPVAFHRAVRDTLIFFGHDEASASTPRLLEL